MAVGPAGIRVHSGHVEDHLHGLKILWRLWVPLTRQIDPETADVHVHFFKDRDDVDRHAALPTFHAPYRSQALPRLAAIERVPALCGNPKY
jgi:hypothetical protein